MSKCCRDHAEEIADYADHGLDYIRPLHSECPHEAPHKLSKGGFVTWWHCYDCGHEWEYDPDV